MIVQRISSLAYKAYLEKQVEMADKERKEQSMVMELLPSLFTEEHGNELPTGFVKGDPGLLFMYPDFN